MNNEQLTRLINTLSIPTFVGRETLLVEYICEFLEKHKINYYKDEFNNIYATKGEAETYPCVVAHTDTVHKITDIIVKQDGNKLYAVDKNNNKTGIGGDNKAGVFVCLELLLQKKVLKAAFFVSEEIGCIGSVVSDFTFYENVRYFMQFDAPFNSWVSHFSDNVELFDIGGQFYKKIKPILVKNLPDFDKIGLGDHPYTDVSVLSRYTNISCINYSVGYYNMHTEKEYVIIDDVELCLNTAKEIIKKLGNKTYMKSDFFRPRNTPLDELKDFSLKKLKSFNDRYNK